MHSYTRADARARPQARARERASLGALPRCALTRSHACTSTNTSTRAHVRVYAQTRPDNTLANA
eukprot:1167005-Pleurochrysis_carterae.AAC.3